MYAPFSTEIGGYRNDELTVSARHAQRRRDPSCPSLMHRLSTKWHRPPTGPDKHAPSSLPVVVGRHAA